MVDLGSPANQKTVFLQIKAAGACCHPCPCDDWGLLVLPGPGVSAPARDLCRQNGCFLPEPGCPVSRLGKAWGGAPFRGVARFVASLDKSLRTEKQKSRLWITPRTKCSECSTCPAACPCWVRSEKPRPGQEQDTGWGRNQLPPRPLRPFWTQSWLRSQPRRTCSRPSRGHLA